MIPHKGRTWFIVLSIAVGLATLGASATMLAHELAERSEHHDDHDHDREGRHGKNERKHDGATRGIAMPSPAYLDACGACHYAYQADLLPDGSWETILSTLDDHFGAPVSLTPDEVAAIREYTSANAADRSGSRLGSKIMGSLGSKQVTRVTEVPYLQRKHRKIPTETFTRASVEGFRNCASCHPDAPAGDFDDDAVRIPAQ